MFLMLTLHDVASEKRKRKGKKKEGEVGVQEDDDTGTAIRKRRANGFVVVPWIQQDIGGCFCARKSSNILVQTCRGGWQRKKDPTGHGAMCPRAFFSFCRTHPEASQPWLAMKHPNQRAHRLERATNTFSGCGWKTRRNSSPDCPVFDASHRFSPDKNRQTAVSCRIPVPGPTTQNTRNIPPTIPVLFSRP